MPTNACSKPSTNNYAADLGAGPAIHKTGKQTSSQRELCQKFVSAPPRKALVVVSSRAPLPSSPIAPADYHFRYLLLIGEKERLKRPLTNRLKLHSYWHSERDLYLYYGFERFDVSGGRRGKFTHQFLN